MHTELYDKKKTREAREYRDLCVHLYIHHLLIDIDTRQKEVISKINMKVKHDVLKSNMWTD